MTNVLYSTVVQWLVPWPLMLHTSVQFPTTDWMFFICIGLGLKAEESWVNNCGALDLSNFLLPKICLPGLFTISFVLSTSTFCLPQTWTMAPEAVFQGVFSQFPVNEDVLERPGPPVSKTQSGNRSFGCLCRQSGYFSAALAGITNLRAAPEVVKTNPLCY